MSLLAPTVEAFFTQRLAGQLQASPATTAAYRDTLRLLLTFARDRAGKNPERLDLADIDADLIAAFLAHLEQQRGNTARTRNARLAAIHSLFRFAALRHPEHAALIQRVLAIPAKKHQQRVVSFLTIAEIGALLAAPDRSSWHGRRDHAILALAAQTGLRVSELTGLNRDDVQLGAGPFVRCDGKGRKERVTPLTAQTAAVIRAWLRECPGGPSDPLFPARAARRLSADAVQWLVAKHAAAAAQQCKSLQAKNITPHTLRHSAAMALLQSGVDPVTIALWLGHESPRSTQPYLHADLELKERALARTTPASTRPGRYHPPDKLLAFLENL
jgi:site-specific recombinase XerD